MAFAFAVTHLHTSLCASTRSSPMYHHQQQKRTFKSTAHKQFEEHRTHAQFNFSNSLDAHVADLNLHTLAV